MARKGSLTFPAREKRPAPQAPEQALEGAPARPKRPAAQSRQRVRRAPRRLSMAGSVARYLPAGQAMHCIARAGTRAPATESTSSSCTCVWLRKCPAGHAGTGEGEPVGRAVGTGVVWTVGVSVGAALGVGVGSGVGSVVGATVGLGVG